MDAPLDQQMRARRAKIHKNPNRSLIYFRSIISIETAAKSLDWMNKSIFVAVGERQPNEAVMHVYRLN